MANKNDNKILIIEDNPDLVEMYNLKFRNDGFEVETANDGEDGINKVIEKKEQEKKKRDEELSKSLIGQLIYRR